MQGSGTFSVEAAVNTLVPRDGHVLVLVNGAYGTRFAKLTGMMGRKVTVFETAEGVPTTPQDVDRLLGADPSITHVGLIHCETSTGILNPLPEIAAVVARHGKSLIVDAMSSFAAIGIDARTTPFDALIAASGKCVEGPPGMGFVFVRRAALEQCAGRSTSLSLDLHDQWTLHGEDHAVALYAANARRRRVRMLRSTSSCRRRTAGAARALHEELCNARLGHDRARVPHLPKPDNPGADHRDLPRARRPALRVQGVLRARSRQGLHPLPGKLTQVETFRVGCIGAIGPEEMRQAVHAVRDTLSRNGHQACERKCDRRARGGVAGQPIEARRRSRRGPSAASSDGFAVESCAHAKQVDRDSRMTVRLALLYALFAVSASPG